MILKWFLNDDPKGLRGSKRFLLKGLKGALIKGLKNTVKLMEEYNLHQIEKLKEFNK